jgi:predicted RNase H-like nuclease
MPKCETRPRAVLGIDAAWTETQRSGVALVEETGQGWRLKAAVSSYTLFQGLAGPAEGASQRAMTPDVHGLLAACRHLIGREPDLVAVDMPLSRLPITRRRHSDNVVSSAYGAMKCGTHSPNERRPGPVSEGLRSALEQRGYVLWTKPEEMASDRPRPGLIEVYPHPALIELTVADERLRYKIGKISRYWPDLAPPLRREELFAVWGSIVAALEEHIGGVEEGLPKFDKNASGRALKAHEDALDAVVCAWVGVCALEGRAKAFGDEVSAVWVPAPPMARLARASVSG